ncbi:hypothetical protein pb186bvf_010076 [Paramecium bursaria]
MNNPLDQTQKFDSFSLKAAKLQQLNQIRQKNSRETQLKKKRNIGFEAWDMKFQFIKEQKFSVDDFHEMNDYYEEKDLRETYDEQLQHLEGTQ